MKYNFKENDARRSGKRHPNTTTDVHQPVDQPTPVMTSRHAGKPWRRPEDGDGSGPAVSTDHTAQQSLKQVMETSQYWYLHNQSLVH